MNHLKWIKENVQGVKGAFGVHLLMNPLQYLCRTLSSAEGYAVMILGLQYMEPGMLGKGALLYIAGVLAAALCCAVDTVFKARVECGIRTRQKQELLKAVLYQKSGGQEPLSMHSAGIQEIMITDVENIVSFFGTQISNFVTPIVVSTVCLAAVLMKSAVIAAVVLISMALTALINLYFLPRLHAQIREVRRVENALTAEFTDTISGSAVIRVFSCQKRYLEGIGRSIQGVLEAQTEEVRIRFRQGLAINLLAFSSMTVPFLVGAVLTVKGRMGLSDMMYITQLSGNLLWFINTLTGTVTELQKTRISRERIESAISQTSSEERPCSGNFDAGGSPDLSDRMDDACAVRLEHLEVTLSGRQILKDISLEIPRGACVAFVGESGCGKSTVFKALQNFVPYQGRISFFGRDSGSLGEGERYGMMSLVSQDVGLIDGTVRENILIGRQAASDGEVRAAAEMAQVDKFTERLEKGLDTEIGENGSLFSGGERQRVALARGLLKAAPVLLLDEVTSALDPGTEERVMAAVESLRGRYTILIIAQKLNTVRSADIIFCLRDGEIAGRGTHQELMESCGEYRRLCKQITFSRHPQT